MGSVDSSDDDPDRNCLNFALKLENSLKKGEIENISSEKIPDFGKVDLDEDNSQISEFCDNGDNPDAESDHNSEQANEELQEISKKLDIKNFASGIEFDQDQYSKWSNNIYQNSSIKKSANKKSPSPKNSSSKKSKKQNVTEECHEIQVKSSAKKDKDKRISNYESFGLTNEIQNGFRTNQEEQDYDNYEKIDNRSNFSSQTQTPSKIATTTQLDISKNDTKGNFRT